MTQLPPSLALPTLPGHTWRPPHVADRPAIAALQAAVAEESRGPGDRPTDYTPALPNGAEPAAGDALGAFDAAGQLAALGWARIAEGVTHEYRVQLSGDVHPRYRGRGLGSAILDWTIASARQLLAARPADRPATFRVEIADSRPAAEPLLLARGFARQFGELRMARSLADPLAPTPFPPGIATVPWTPEHADQFFAAHEAAWRTRPPGAALTAEEWVAAWAGGDEFSADLSLLTLADDRAIGLILSEIDRAESLGWISKVGVDPAWRGRGVAAALIGRALRGFRDAALATAELEVGDDNPGARRLYERLGFAVVGHRTVFAREP